MATTTNYGWTTPDDTALVKDGASAIRTLGSSVDTTTKNLNPSTTLGDIEYRSSTSNVNTRLGIGSTGNVLTVAGGVPTWAAPAGGAPALAQIATGNVNSGTSLTISSLSSYDTLMLYINGITLNTADPLYLQINSVATSGNYRGAGGFQNSSPSIQNKRYAGSDEINLTNEENVRTIAGNNTFILLLTNCKATGFTTWQYACAFRNNADNTCNSFGSGIYTSAAAVSDLKIFTPNTSTFTGSGTYIIYGG